MRLEFLAFASTLVSAVFSAPLFVWLNGKLEMVPNAKTKINLLSQQGGASSFVFDFNNPSPSAVVDQSNTSQIVSANCLTFPVLGGLDGSLNLFKVGPCGLIMPHTHPRGNEFIMVTQGEFLTEFLTESGSEVISNKLTAYQATMFPQGSIHYELNPTCQTSVFLGSFNSNDPGTLLVTPGVLQLEDNLVINQLGGIINGEDLESIRHALPPGPISFIEKCLESCKIQKRAERF